jgi:hypothetical protein
LKVPSGAWSYSTAEHSIIMDSSANEYYSQHSIIQAANNNISVKYIDDKRHKGLTSNQSIPAASIIYIEQPLVAIQHSHNKRYILSCDYCLKALGSIRDQWIRLGGFEEKELSNNLPYINNDDKEFSDPEQAFNAARYEITPIPCDLGCSVHYCSLQCRELSNNRYHKILCPREKEIRPERKYKKSAHNDESESSCCSEEESSESEGIEEAHPILRYYQFVDSVNDIFRMVAKVIAIIIQKAENSLAKLSSSSSSSNVDYDSVISSAEYEFQLFTQLLWWEQVSAPSDLEENKEKELEFREELKELCDTSAKLFKQALPSYAAQPHYKKLFTANYFGRLVSLFEMNNIEIFAACPVYTYIAHLQTLPDQQLSAVRAAIGSAVYAQLIHDMNNDRSHRVQGTGLFSIACMMNHSCDPNVLPVKRENEEESQGFIDLDFTTAFQAIREIEEGEELTISYIDHSEPYSTRKAELADYNFLCACSKCAEEEVQEH